LLISRPANGSAPKRKSDCALGVAAEAEAARYEPQSSRITWLANENSRTCLSAYAVYERLEACGNLYLERKRPTYLFLRYLLNAGQATVS